MLASAGFANGPLTAYISDQESSTAFGIYASGCGLPRRRKCSIPQGDPWSMVFLALSGTAWLNAMKCLS
eukprot:11527815-Alexandrium_andersonii.AAC.1